MDGEQNSALTPHGNRPRRSAVERPRSHRSERTPKKTLVTIADLSATSGLSVSTIRRLAREGRIPFVQPSGKGGKLLFPPDAIERSSLAACLNSHSSARLAGPPPSWMSDQT
jgi:excisionase family DNA binding protein